MCVQLSSKREIGVYFDVVKPSRMIKNLENKHQILIFVDFAVFSYT